MTFITLFSSPKPFTDPHVSMIQRNAIESWTHLPDAEVLLLGDEIGLATTAQELGVRHLNQVTINAQGTPLISSMFQLARENSTSPLLCIVNTDMLLMPDLIGAAKRVSQLKEKFVMLSQRRDMNVTAPLEYTKGWEDRLRTEVGKEGKLHRPAGSDYFIFPRSCFTEIPDFAIGRAGWDNWMIYEARKQSWPVVDCTESVLIVHQEHDYSHLPGGEPHYSLPESNENIRLAGGEAAIRYTVIDATHILRGDKLTRPRFSYLRFMRLVELFLRKIFFFLPANLIEEVARPKRWKKRIQRMLGQGKS